MQGSTYDLISVIVPVYNTELYIRDCLDSIVEQTYPNLEVIVIDDGSTDQSGRICDEYASNHPFINVYHQENEGLSVARNVGMDRMHGDWVVFVDSDDYLHPVMIQTLYEVAIRENVSLVRCAFEKSVLNRPEYKWNLTSKGENIQIRKICPCDEMRDILNNDKLSVVWGALYKRDLLEGVFFLKGYTFEDVLFIPEVLSKVKELVRIDDVYCVYRQVNTSISHTIALQKGLDLYAMMKRRIKQIQEFFPELECLAVNRFWSQSMNFYNKIVEQGTPEQLSDLQNNMRKAETRKTLSCSVIFDKNIPASNRIMLLGCKISFVGTCRIKRMLIRIHDAC